MRISRKKLGLTKLFEGEDSKFVLMTGFKFAIIALVGVLFIYYLSWLIISLNNIFFETKGYSSDLVFKEGFMNNALALIYDKLPHLFFFFIFNFFSGVYVAKILLRPFVVIGSYALDKTNQRDVIYSPDLFSDYKLLTRFSEIFFRYIDYASERKVLAPQDVPIEFTRIRKPKFEKVFFFHFMLFVGIIALITTIFAVQLATTIQVQLASLSVSSIVTDKSTMTYFLNSQTEVFQSVIYMSVFFMSTGYVLLSFHLYGKVSGAIFGFFATMKSFMRGNTKARVHLIGYSHIRPYSRYLNKYLDQVERECSKVKNEVKSSSNNS